MIIKNPTHEAHELLLCNFLNYSQNNVNGRINVYKMHGLKPDRRGLLQVLDRSLEERRVYPGRVSHLASLGVEHHHVSRGRALEEDPQVEYHVKELR